MKVAASRNNAIPAALLRKREKWLKAIGAGDIRAVLKVGRSKPADKGASPELQRTDIDDEIGILVERAYQRIDALKAEANAALSAYQAEKDGMSQRQQGARMKAIEAMLAEQGELIRWVEDARLLRIEEWPYFFASPAEAMLRAGKLDGLREVLRQWGAPKRRYLRGFYYSAYDAGWTSASWLPFDVQFSAKDIPLVTLAAIRGDTAAMQILVLAGLCPTGLHAWWDEEDALLRLDEKIKQGIRRQAAKVLRHYGMARGGLPAAANRLARMHDLGQQLEDAFGPETYKKGGRKKAFALLKKGAPVSYFPLAVATAENDLEMLEALFAAGGDPNCRYRDGVPMLAKLSDASLDGVEVWLRHGACPLMFHDPDEPDFGDGLCPSPLYEAVWEGNLDLTRLLLEKAVVQPVIAYREGRKFANPLADMAKERGHAKLAAYLKDYAARMKVCPGLPDN